MVFNANWSYVGCLPTGPQELESQLANMEAQQAAVWDSHLGVKSMQNYIEGYMLYYEGKHHNPNYKIR